MKKLILTLALLSGAAQAEMCNEMADFAKLAMKARQENVSMQVLMKTTDKVVWMQAMVREVYRTFRYETEMAKYDAIRDYENRIFADCLNIQADVRKQRGLK